MFLFLFSKFKSNLRIQVSHSFITKIPSFHRRGCVMTNHTTPPLNVTSRTDCPMPLISMCTPQRLNLREIFRCQCPVWRSRCAQVDFRVLLVFCLLSVVCLLSSVFAGYKQWTVPMILGQPETRCWPILRTSYRCAGMFGLNYAVFFVYLLYLRGEFLQIAASIVKSQNFLYC